MFLNFALSPTKVFYWIMVYCYISFIAYCKGSPNPGVAAPIFTTESDIMDCSVDYTIGYMYLWTPSARTHERKNIGLEKIKIHTPLYCYGIPSKLQSFLISSKNRNQLIKWPVIILYCFFFQCEAKWLSITVHCSVLPGAHWSTRRRRRWVTVCLSVGYWELEQALISSAGSDPNIIVRTLWSLSRLLSLLTHYHMKMGYRRASGIVTHRREV